MGGMCDRKPEKEARRVEMESQFKYDSVQDAATLKRYLDAVNAGFAKGAIRFAWKDEEIVLHPSGLIGFSVEARSKGGRMNLCLNFAWRESPDDKEVEEGGLTVESGPAGELA